jgi:E3 ubiquitin-protein ligase SHPRH
LEVELDVHIYLLGTEEDAKRAMAQLTQDATKKHLTREALLLDTPFLDGSGIVSLTQQLKPTRDELATKPQPQKIGLYNRAVQSRKLVCDHLCFHDAVDLSLA